MKVIVQEIADVDRAIAEGETDGLLKVYVSKGKIIGGTLIAKNAGELVGELVMAMTLNIPFKKIFDRVFPYPTMLRVNRKAASKHLGEKLTPKAANFLKKMFHLLNK